MNTSITKAIFLLVSSLLLTACMGTYGVRQDPSTINNFEIGKTTFQEVIEALGKPTAVVTNSNGMKTITYMFVDTEIDSTMYIPIVGPLIGGVSSESEGFTLSFSNNLLTQVIQTNSQGRTDGLLQSN